MKSLRIIFLGTAEFAVPSLEALCESHHNVVAVVTAPEKPQGRGRKTLPTPIKRTAIKYDIPVLEPVKLKDPEFIKQLESYKADLQVVVAFRILPEIVWNMPPKGTFNLHAALLPQYRGAAPIQWAIINGEKETGLTTFFLDQGIDTGHLLFMEKEPIHKDDTLGTLYQRLRLKGAKLVLKTTDAIALGNYTKHPQPIIAKDLLKKAPKIHKETCEIDWTQNGEKLRNFVRGLSPHPGAWAILNEKKVKIFQLNLIDKESEPPLKPGEIRTDEKTYLHIGTSTTPVAIKQLQVAGKKSMEITSFLHGNKL